jgi:hypothetical protein
MDLILKTRAIHKLRPNKEWVLDQEIGLKFVDNKVIAPTEEEIAAMMMQIQAQDVEIELLKANQKIEVLQQLGITEDQAKLLLS